NNPVDVMRNIQFRIFTKSVNSKDVNRDKKIRDQFFGTMSNTQEITGAIKSLDGDESTGEGILILKMNDLEKELPVEYSVEGEVIKLRCVLDLNDWEGKAAIDALNKVCEEKHTGLDGSSIFWPDVKILVQSTLKKDCN
ncbi:YceI family protein, partial [candidate division KSB1 bacterium]|nr:YceI family protein [candidate division KSB1 bacterium]